MSYLEEAYEIIERIIPILGENTLMMGRDGNTFLQNKNDKIYGLFSDFFPVNDFKLGNHIWYIDLDKKYTGEMIIRTRYMESNWRELTPTESRNWFLLEMKHD